MLDSSGFKFVDRFDNFDSEEYFNKIITLAIHAYFEILKSKRYVKADTIGKRENQYRDDIVETMINIQEDYGFNNLIINCEAQEKGDNLNQLGLLDIKIQYRNLRDIKFTNKYYHTIECKRFGSDLNITDYYNHGVLEFLNGKYSSNANFAGFICFVEKFRNGWVMEDIVMKINEKLRKNNLATLNPIHHDDYEYVYKLTAPRNYNNKNINLIHLMLDYSSIYFDN